MNYTKIKPNQATKALSGVTLEFDSAGETAKRLHIRDAAGGYLLIEAQDYCGLVTFVPAAPKLVKRWRVMGKIAGVEIAPQEFEAAYAAEALVNEHDNHSDALYVEEVEVPDPAELP